jgi:hypothetical protein
MKELKCEDATVFKVTLSNDLYYLNLKYIMDSLVDIDNHKSTTSNIFQFESTLREGDLVKINGIIYKVVIFNNYRWPCYKVL